MLSYMHEGSEYGFLKVGQRVITPIMLASMVGVTEGVIKGLLKELEEADVFSVDENGCIYSRRMVRDEILREKRAAGGKKGASHGVKGGRPKKTVPSESSEGVIHGDTEGVIQGVVLKGQNNPPSSSSSNNIIYISKEGKDFFRIGLKVFEQKPSEYLEKNMKITIEKFMMSIFRGVELKAVYEKLDEEYFGYEFESDNHLRNTFKAVADKLMKDQGKGKPNSGAEKPKGFVLGQKPRGAVNHG